jgi:hypothetical protein
LYRFFCRYYSNFFHIHFERKFFARNPFAGTVSASGTVIRNSGSQHFPDADAVAGPSGIGDVQSSPSLHGSGSQQNSRGSQSGHSSVQSGLNFSGTISEHSRPSLPGGSKQSRARLYSVLSNNKPFLPMGSSPVRFRPPVLTGRGKKILDLSLARGEKEKARDSQDTIMVAEGSSDNAIFQDICREDELTMPDGTVVATTNTAVIVADGSEVNFFLFMVSILLVVLRLFVFLIKDPCVISILLCGKKFKSPFFSSFA